MTTVYEDSFTFILFYREPIKIFYLFCYHCSKPQYCAKICLASYSSLIEPQSTHSQLKQTWVRSLLPVGLDNAIRSSAQRWRKLARRFGSSSLFIICFIRAHMGLTLFFQLSTVTLEIVLWSHSRDGAARFYQSNAFSVHKWSKCQDMPCNFLLHSSNIPRCRLHFGHFPAVFTHLLIWCIWNCKSFYMTW